MKKVVITGATGFIGAALTKKLLQQGVTVYGIDINDDKLETMKQYGDFIPVVADFSKYDKLSEMISERGFDYFVHMAWSGAFGGEKYYNYYLHNQNIDATCTACEQAAKLSAKRLIFCGSSYESMIAEEFNSPVNYYGIAKKTAADYCMAICRKKGIECNIAVLTNTFGVGDFSQKAVNTFLKNMINNEDLSLIKGERRNDWMYISDTVNGLIAVAQSPYSFKKYYVGHNDITTFKEKLIDMKKILQSKSELKFGEYNDDTFVDYDAFDLNALHNDTGFECKADFKESILKTAEWVKSLNWK